MPTVSGVPLKNYRFETVGGNSVWVYDRKAGMYTRALNLEALEARRGLESAASRRLNAVQSAVERYYAALEAMERDG
jgi:hypothetical protein